MLAFIELIHGTELKSAAPAEPPAKIQPLDVDRVVELVAAVRDLALRGAPRARRTIHRLDGAVHSEEERVFLDIEAAKVDAVLAALAALEHMGAAQDHEPGLSRGDLEIAFPSFDPSSAVDHERRVAVLELRVKRLRVRLRAAWDVAELADRRLHTVLEEHSLARCEACSAVVPEDEIRTVGDDAVPLCAACYEEEVTP